MTQFPRLPLLALATLLGSAVLFAGPAAARKGGGDGAEPTAAQKEVRSLKHQISVTELFFALNLDAEQQASLADLIAPAIAEREAKQAARAADAPRLAGLLDDYLADVQGGGEPGATTVAALKAFREEERGDRDTKRDQRKEMKASLQSILTDDQQETLRTFRPMVDLGPSEEERAERKEARQDELNERARSRGMDDEMAAERMDRRAERGRHLRERRGGKRNVRGLLFSAEMLELLR
ncbi:MAG: hypothetical protein KDA24_10480 [Deltaproteobacteria bacterium]|nr:hypothetical protein [Deltaproteobacteria bacterium]